MANRNQSRAGVDSRTADSDTRLDGMIKFEKTIARLETRSGVQFKKPLGEFPNQIERRGGRVYNSHALYKKLYGQLSNPTPSASAYAPTVMVPVRAAGPGTALR